MKPFVRIAALLSLSVLGVFAQTAEQHLQKCDASYGKSHYADAVKHCTKAIAVKPGFEEALQARAAAYEKLGNIDAAIVDHTELIRVTDGMAMFYFHRAGLYQKKGRKEAALADLTAAIAKDPSGRYAARAHYQRGLLYDELRRADEAQEDYGMAVKLDPKMTAAQEKLKYPFGDLTITEAADRILPGVATPSDVVTAVPAATPKAVVKPTPAPQYQPTSPPLPQTPVKTAPPKPAAPAANATVDPTAWAKALSVGTAKLNKKDYEGAVKSYSECLTYASGAVLCLKNRAMAYYFLKKYEPALSDIDAAIKISPDAADFYSIRAFIRYNSDDLIGASVDMDRAVKLEPENPEWYANRALINCKIKEFAFLAKDDEDKARSLGGKIAKPCKP